MKNAKNEIFNKFIYYLQKNNFDITYIDKVCFTNKLAESYTNKKYPEIINDLIIIAVYKIIDNYIYENYIILDPLKIKVKV